MIPGLAASVAALFYLIFIDWTGEWCYNDDNRIEAV